jgi:hypothetical protein
MENNKKFRELISMADSFPSVQPQTHRNPNSLFTIEPCYNTYSSLTRERNYIVDESNIESTKADFRTDNIQIGDQVVPFDDGGWEVLAGRAGVDVIRDGKIIISRITRMN